jgi:hypothetical protein
LKISDDHKERQSILLGRAGAHLQNRWSEAALSDTNGLDQIYITDGEGLYRKGLAHYQLEEFSSAGVVLQDLYE